jgi:hypothetical protein
LLTRVLSKLAFAVVVLLSSTSALADAGVFTGNGQNLRQITSKSIRLKSINVDIALGRGPFLFDGTVAGMDEVRYDCKFVLQNLTNSGEEVEVGFPVDSEFAHNTAVQPTRESMQDWVLNYGFIALDEKNTYPVELVHRKPAKGANDFGTIFVWKMNFGPGETRILRVSYHMPISMGLVSTERDERSAKPAPSESFSQEFLTLALMEFAGYVTSTGSSWSGNVEKAVFTVYLDRFERYLDLRGITEENSASKNSDDSQGMTSFPVRKPWWFRQVSPSGWIRVEGGIQWQFRNYKPQDPITVAYYMTQLPKSAAEVRPFVERFLKGLGQNESAQVELRNLREFILASYGKEPDDPRIRAFASEQKWYAPRKDFSVTQLSREQRAVIAEFEQEITDLGGR